MTRRRWPKGTYMKIKSGALLREMMKARGVSNRDLGRYAEQDRTAISRLVNERRPTCTTKTAELIAEFFQVPVEVLFDPRTSTSSCQKYVPQNERPTG